MAMALRERPVPRPEADGFYLPPYPLPPSEPGTLLRSRRSSVRLVPGVRVPVRCVQILYVSRDASDRPIGVSGTLLVPVRPWRSGPRPLIAYGVGAHGLAPASAPSYLMRRGLDWETMAVGALLARGWAVVVTDYEGSGTPGPHAYTVGASAGHTVLDAARAALRHPAAGLSPESAIGILGYSEGGQAAAWAGELQPSYAPELRLRGIAAGGVPRDLAEVARSNEGGPFFAVVLLASIGQATADPSLTFFDVLTEEGRTAVEIATTRSIYRNFARLRGRRLHEFTTLRDPLDDPAWQAALARSRCGRRAPGAPVFIYGGRYDQAVPYTETMGLAEDYRALGADVTTRTYPLEHLGAAVAGLPSAITFLAARLR